MSHTAASKPEQGTTVLVDLMISLASLVARPRAVSYPSPPQWQCLTSVGLFHRKARRTAWGDHGVKSFKGPPCVMQHTDIVRYSGPGVCMA